MAEALAGEDLFVRPWLDDNVDPRHPRLVPEVGQLIVQVGLIDGHRWRPAIGKIAQYISHLQKVVGRGKVGTARYRHRAEPVFVGIRAGRTVDGQRILSGGFRLTRGECQSVGEVFHVALGVGIVERGEIGRDCSIDSVGGDGPRDAITERKIKDQLAVVICGS